MRFSPIPSLIPLLAFVSPTYAFVLMQACNGANGGQPCVNWPGTLPSACYDFAAHGQDKTVSDTGCSGESVTLTKTAVTLADVGFDKRASSFNGQPGYYRYYGTSTVPSWTENRECLAGNNLRFAHVGAPTWAIVQGHTQGWFHQKAILLAATFNCCQGIHTECPRKSM
ncbi:hypothetical protein C8R45DRAFT_940999 [Mycena sanguinolenta]|nr:hypothetical protein C8R45DRAFT_940999 [Mycena sanguinolenta]